MSVLTITRTDLLKPIEVIVEQDVSAEEAEQLVDDGAAVWGPEYEIPAAIYLAVELTQPLVELRRDSCDTAPRRHRPGRLPVGRRSNDNARNRFEAADRANQQHCSQAQGSR